MTIDDTTHQRNLLRAHLRKLLALDTQLAQRPEDVSLVIQRDETAAAIDALGAALGLGALPAALPEAAAAVGLRDEAITALQSQERLLEAFRKATELQLIGASGTRAVSLQMALDRAAERLGDVNAQLARLRALGPEPPAAPPHPPVPPPAPPPAEPPGLRALLLRCPEYFGSHRELRDLFADPRLLPFGGGLPERDNMAARVDATIAYMRDKRTASGQKGLVLLLDALAERYHHEDARQGELLKLAAELRALAGPGTQAAPSEGSSVPEVNRPRAGRRARMNLSISEMELALRRARAVAQVSLAQIVDGRRRSVPSGTAWLIAPGLAITCWHVVESRGRNAPQIDPDDLDEQLQNCLLTFRYTVAGHGVDYSVQRLEYAHRDSTQLDYALLRLNDRDEAPLAQYGFLPVERSPQLRSISDLYIIQYPDGEPQQQSDGSFERQQPARQGGILYTNRTAGGASGAPVLERTSWRAVAIHHGASADDFGEGILIGAILADLERERPRLASEILTAQQGA